MKLNNLYQINFLNSNHNNKKINIKKKKKKKRKKDENLTIIKFMDLKG